jgi:hypothetical protein
MPDRRQNSDHDLLVTLHEQVKQIRTDIKDLKDGTSATIQDHETRLRFLEKYQARIVGALGVINVLFIAIELYLKFKH